MKMIIFCVNFPAASWKEKSFGRRILQEENVGLVYLVIPETWNSQIHTPMIQKLSDQEFV